MTPTKMCELCSAESAHLSAFQVEPREDAVELCETCLGQMGPEAKLDVNHWHCLNGSIWSESAAVKVLAWRMLQRLSAESWALDLLDQLQLDDGELEWARAGAANSGTGGDSGNAKSCKDSNGTALQDGDSVTLIKDLDVKGAGFTAKRGMLVKKISLTDDPGLVEARVNGTQIVLKTCFLKKAT